MMLTRCKSSNKYSDEEPYCNEVHVLQGLEECLLEFTSSLSADLVVIVGSILEMKGAFW